MLDFDSAFAPRGLAGETGAPMNASAMSADGDSPPGAPAYASGPLAIQPSRPTPTPSPNLTTLANGGMNHAEAWNRGLVSPDKSVEQKPFSIEGDTPPGAGGYASGPLANPPTPTPTPRMNRFTFSHGYEQ